MNRRHQDRLAPPHRGDVPRHEYDVDRAADRDRYTDASLAPRQDRQWTKGEFEKFKTSEQFDGTAKNPHWLETAKL